MFTAEERAKRSAEAMWDSDVASKWFGMSLDEVSEGRAVMSLTLEAHHCNGHGIGHGGVTFSLADSAFAFACNSRNQVTVAQHNSIHFLAATQKGDTLTATAVERHSAGRSGVYDVTVINQDQTVVAEFRGLSRQIKGHLFEEPDT